MEANLITGILISEFNEINGPEATCLIPQDLSDEIQSSVSAITIDSFSGGKNLTKKLLFIPFPTINKKGLVRMVEWIDPKRRGGKGLATITLLFEEKDDPIFYKYLKDFENPFEKITDQIIAIRQKHGDNKESYTRLEDFQTDLLELLDSLSKQELKMKNAEQFPITAEDMKTNTGGINYSFKLIVVGDPMVGKSSTILRFTDKAFRRSYIPTIGVNITDKVIRLDNQNIELILWDLAGQSKYQRVRRQFYGGSVGAVMVYDLTQPETFENISNWYKDICATMGNTPEFKFILCGNKKDRTNEIKVTTTQGEELAKKLHVYFLETSALTGEKIDDAFHELVHEILRIYKDPE